MVEFFIVALFVLIPFAMGILQLATLVTARHVLDHATFLAARAGSVTHGSQVEMRRHLARGLAALHVRAPLDAASDGWQPGPGDVAASFAAAWAEVQVPTNVQLAVLNPTADSFAAFEISRYGVREIPSEALDRTPLRVSATGQTLREANLLKIRVSRCQRLIFPLIDRLIVSSLRLFDPDPFAQQCYARGGVVLRSQAMQPMQSSSRREALGI